MKFSYRAVVILLVAFLGSVPLLVRAENPSSFQASLQEELKNQADETIKVSFSRASLKQKDLSADVRVVPYFIGGRTNGIKVLKVTQGGYFEKIGFRAGDILLGIDWKGADMKDGKLFRPDVNAEKVEYYLSRSGKLVLIAVAFTGPVS